MGALLTLYAVELAVCPLPVLFHYVLMCVIESYR